MHKKQCLSIAFGRRDEREREKDHKQWLAKSKLSKKRPLDEESSGTAEEKNIYEEKERPHTHSGVCDFALG